MQTQGLPATHFRRGWIYVLTLALVTINYMDRSALGVVAQAVRTEFKLSPVQMGYLFSSFLWTYVIFLLPIGIMLDRFTRAEHQFASASRCGRWPWRRPQACGALPTLIITRLVMGAGEATSIPSCGRIVREWMPAKERGIANVFWSAGSFVGPAIGALVVACDHQRLGLARGFPRARRARLGLARLQPDLVRPAGKGAAGCPTPNAEDSQRALRRVARRDRRCTGARRCCSIFSNRRRMGRDDRAGLGHLYAVSAAVLAAELSAGDQAPHHHEDRDLYRDPVGDCGAGEHRHRSHQRPAVAARHAPRRSPPRHGDVLRAACGGVVFVPFTNDTTLILTLFACR